MATETLATAGWEGGLASSRAARLGRRLGRGVTGLIVVLVALAALGALALTAGPRVLPYQTYHVVSGSMAPAIPVGAVVVLHPAAAADLAVGDIITFARPERPGEFVTHRIAAIEGGAADRAFVTKGDANPLPDTWRVRGAGQGWRVALIIPRLGVVMSLLRGPWGRLALLGVPGLGLAFHFLADIWRPARRPAGGHA